MQDSYGNIEANCSGFIRENDALREGECDEFEKL